MKGRNTKTIPFFKVDNTEKIVVYRAGSLEHEIRFYLTDMSYITGSKCNDGKSYCVKYEDEKEECGKENNKEKRTSIFKENFKALVLMILIGFIVLIGVEILMGYLYIYEYLNNFGIAILIISCIPILTLILIFLLSEMKRTSYNLKSKHSAEHMMCNFLEKNSRLPRTMDEIKKCSRFSKKCDNQEKMRKIGNIFGVLVICSIFSVIANILLSFFLQDRIWKMNITIDIFYVLLIFTICFMKKCKKIKSVFNTISIPVFCIVK